MGFGPTFRFGNPFFLQPGVDELLWRMQFKDNLSWVRGRHTIKVGGEWLHTLNDQVFRGFFTGRYLFDSVTGLPALRVAAAAGGFGPGDGRLLERRLRHGAGARVPPAARRRGGPLLFYLQGAGRTGPATDAAGASQHHQRRVLAVRPGSVAGASEPDAQLRPALGRADDAGDRRSAHDGVRPRS